MENDKIFMRLFIALPPLGGLKNCFRHRTDAKWRTKKKIHLIFQGKLSALNGETKAETSPQSL
jgi:hypothetical protein